MTMDAFGLRRRKPTLKELKIAVVGAPGVGKSALAVRFLTKRYIGEYDRRTENRYKYEHLAEGGELALFEIVDTCSKPKESEKVFNPTEVLQWADGILLIYSIDDRDSFKYFQDAKTELQLEIPLHLVGNKSDMVHIRRVGGEEAENLAKELKSKFTEVSAAEDTEAVIEVFSDMCKEVIASKRKSKQGLLERMWCSRPYSRGKSDSNLGKE